MPQATHLLATDPRARATNLSLRLVRRLDVASASADALVDDYLATDTPVVLTGLLGAAPAERLATLLALARRIPRVAHATSTDIRAESIAALQAELQAMWPFQREEDGGWSWHRHSEDAAQWGCRRELPQCGLSWWPIAHYLGADRRVGEPLPPRSGASPHVDRICTPGWSLQLLGRKRWLFPVRRPGDPTPFGEAYDHARSTEAWAVTLEPGELMLFANGWVVHTTEAVPPDGESAGSTGGAGAGAGGGGGDEDETDQEPHAASLHGMLYVPRLAARLFGADAMRRRCGGRGGGGGGGGDRASSATSGIDLGIDAMGANATSGIAGCEALSDAMGDAQCRDDILKLNPAMRLSTQRPPNKWVSFQRALRQRRSSMIDQFVRTSSTASRDAG